MVFMNFGYIEHYGACFGDDIDIKMNYFKHIKWLFNVYSEDLMHSHHKLL